MKVLVLSPGYPFELGYFTRALARRGAAVLGVGEGSPAGLAPAAREALAAWLPVPSLFDEAAVVEEVGRWPAARGVDRVECLWEPGVLLAARVREALGVPGLDLAGALPFRDKEAMKRVLDDAGVRTPRHRRATTVREVREAAEEIGYPLIVKPIAGAGSADTHRVGDAEALDTVLERMGHVEEVSVEEFVEGEEYTFDAISAGGRIGFSNVSWYRPRPLVARTNEWISAQTIALRDVDAPRLAGGVEMGRAVLQALGFPDGFTHMEWFLTPEGEAVFGEIGARPAGARSTDIMNYAADYDVYAAWAEAVLTGRLERPVTRPYNAAIVVKRARGQGRILRIEGLDRLRHDLGDALVAMDLLPVGAPRRNWKQTLLSDGWLIVRHPDLETTIRLADRVGTDLHLLAG